MNGTPWYKTRLAFVAMMLVCVMVLVPSLVAFGAVDAASVTKWGQLVGGLYKASPSTLADGETDVLRITQSGLLRVSYAGREELSLLPIQPASFWSITNAAAVNAVATATQAAGAAGVRHVCTGVQITPWQDATGTISAAGGYTWALRDGATGVGTIKASGTFSFPVVAAGAISPMIIQFPTPIVGTAATAMCVEITSSALLHTGCTVNAQGFDIK